MVAQAERKPAGKSSSITKRIKKIKENVEERGSRRKFTFLKDFLLQTLKEAITAHESLVELLGTNEKDFNDDWIGNLSLRVNTCYSEIECYFAERGNDTPSVVTPFTSGSFVCGVASVTGSRNTERWRNHVPEMYSNNSWLIHFKQYNISSTHAAGDMPTQDESPVQPTPTGEGLCSSFDQMNISVEDTICLQIAEIHCNRERLGPTKLANVYSALFCRKTRCSAYNFVSSKF